MATLAVNLYKEGRKKRYNVTCWAHCRDRMFWWHPCTHPFVDGSYAVKEDAEDVCRGIVADLKAHTTVTPDGLLCDCGWLAKTRTVDSDVGEFQWNRMSRHRRPGGEPDKWDKTVEDSCTLSVPQHKPVLAG